MIVRDDDIEDLASASTPSATRSRSAATATACCAPSSRFEDAQGAADLLHLQLQARHLVPVRARAPASSSATPSASCSSRPLLGAELPFEPELERWFPLWGIPI